MDRRAHVASRPGRVAHVVRTAARDPLVSCRVRLGVVAARCRRFLRCRARAHDRVVPLRHVARRRGVARHRHLARGRRTIVGRLPLRRGMARVVASGPTGHRRRWFARRAVRRQRLRRRCRDALRNLHLGDLRCVPLRLQSDACRDSRPRARRHRRIAHRPRASGSRSHRTDATRSRPQPAQRAGVTALVAHRRSGMVECRHRRVGRRADRQRRVVDDPWNCRHRLERRRAHHS